MAEPRVEPGLAAPANTRSIVLGTTLYLCCGAWTDVGVVLVSGMPVWSNSASRSTPLETLLLVWMGTAAILGLALLFVLLIAPLRRWWLPSVVIGGTVFGELLVLGLLLFVLSEATPVSWWMLLLPATITSGAVGLLLVVARKHPRTTWAATAALLAVVGATGLAR